MTIGQLRREYTLGGLRRRDLDADPIRQFQVWFDQAREARASGRFQKFFVNAYKALLGLGSSAPVDVNAMTLATADKEGRPSARMVLLKGVDARGFIFFTNYESRKGNELKDNPKAALVFYWADLERQVCVAGEANKIPREESEAYFRTRPRGSRIGAWASKQSEVLPDRGALEETWKKLEAQYPGEDIAMPPYWGGYVLSPIRIEFWQGRPNRLHDRFRYTKGEDGKWVIERLSP